MKEEEMLYCLIAFILGYFICRMVEYKSSICRLNNNSFVVGAPDWNKLLNKGLNKGEEFMFGKKFVHNLKKVEQLKTYHRKTPNSRYNFSVILNTKYPKYSIQCIISINALKYLDKLYLDEKCILGKKCPSQTSDQLANHIVKMITTQTQLMCKNIKHEKILENMSKLKIYIYNNPPQMSKLNKQGQYPNYYENITNLNEFKSITNEKTRDGRLYANTVCCFVSLGGGAGSVWKPLKNTMAMSLHNLICTKGERFRSQGIYIHEFAHVIKEIGMKDSNTNLHEIMEEFYKIFIKNDAKYRCISGKENDKVHHSHPYDCQPTELFAEASQVWFYSTKLRDETHGIEIPEKMNDLRLKKAMKVIVDGKETDTNILSLYDYMGYIYGPPNKTLCVDNLFKGCKYFHKNCK